MDNSCPISTPREGAPDLKQWKQKKTAPEQMTQEMGDEPEVKLPSLEEQKAIVAEFKRLEAEGKLTPEVLEKHFGQFNKKNDTPIH